MYTVACISHVYESDDVNDPSEMLCNFSNEMQLCKYAIKISKCSISVYILINGDSYCPVKSFFLNIIS